MAKKDNENENKSGGKGKFIIIILLVIILAGGGAFAGFYFFMQSKNGDEKPIEEVTYVISKETKVNLSTDDDKSSKSSYLLTGISVSYDKSNSDLGKEIESKKIQLQDTAIWYLKSKKKEDFTASNKDVLKKELADALNKKLNEGKLVDVYYSTGEDSADFMVQ